MSQDVDNYMPNLPYVICIFKWLLIFNINIRYAYDFKQLHNACEVQCMDGDHYGSSVLQRL